MTTAASPSSKRRRQGHRDKTFSESSATKGNTPLVVFAHGAGAPSTSEWMLRWKKKIEEELNAIVVTFDYPYISGGKRKAPPKAERLVDHHLDVVKDAVSKHPGHPLVLVGKSMGSRVSCMVTTKEDILVAAIVCLGYPLKCPSVLHVIDGGDHSFKIGKKQQQSTGVGQDEAEQGALKAMAEFVSKSISEEEGCFASEISQTVDDVRVEDLDLEDPAKPNPDYALAHNEKRRLQLARQAMMLPSGELGEQATCKKEGGEEIEAADAAAAFPRGS
ncbi:hypothetical protein ZIOFF_048236 [Zingiber officinale]|uniref:KANL3/Tex30 alpha/beta hydrolase-like domain-containing protein n=1 Tax=Zingiber officinale TaxID=94328 RepID=A0A8J5FPD5_ZINOF|nr:hypothetical protein ZIOFF_048236 [Zingiber officinale]